MSVTTLKEIDAKQPGDQTLLDLFQHCREHVLAVAATHLMPNHLAVTTQGGFVELINTKNGEFRLFLAHLDSIPLDAALRCFSLVPSYFSEDGDDDDNDEDGRLGAESGAPRFRRVHGGTFRTKSRSGPFLAFSLAFSNELLLADVSSGETAVLASFRARPRSLFCDGDYMVCGDGSGRVVAWRANAGAARGTGVIAPTQVWSRPVFADAVVALRVHRDVLLCASADYQCLVLSMDTGLSTARLAHAPSPLVALLPLVTPLVPTSVMALCSSTHISVFAEPHAAIMTQSALAAAVPTTGREDDMGSSTRGDAPVLSWGQTSGLALDVEVQCATCFAGHLALGTASGVVLLFRCNAVTGEVVELVRFDVGHAVLGVQLYAGEALVVVTAAGDVWKWPLRDLLEGAEVEEMGQREGGTTPRVADGVEGGEGATAQHPQANGANFSVDTSAEDAFGPRPRALQPRPSGTRAPSPPPAVDRTAIPDRDDRSTPTSEQRTGGFPPDSGSLSSTTACPAGEHQSGARWLTAAPASLSSSSASEDVSSLTTRATGAPLATEATPSGVAAVDTQPALFAAAEPFARTDAALAEAMAATTSSATMGTVPLHDPFSEKKQIAEGAGRQGPPASADGGRCSSTGSSKLTTSSSTSATTSRAASQEAEQHALTPHRKGQTTSPPSPVPRTEEHATARLSARDGNNTSSESSDAEVDAQGPRAASSGTTATTMPTTVSVSTAHTHHPTASAPLPLDVDAPMQAFLARQVSEVAEVLGPLPSPTIAGLRSGRRMDRRAVEHALAMEAEEREARQGGDGHDGDEAEPSAVPPLQSTALLLEQRAALEAATFDFDAYAKAHALEVAALPYQHPIRPVRYTLEDRVFAAVTGNIEEEEGRTRPRIEGESGTRDGNVALREEGAIGRTRHDGTPPAAISPAVKDDLMDVTYGRVTRRVDPTWAEERRRRGPNICEHPCSDLIFQPPDPSETVLFTEYQLKPADPQPLLLPMPLPPTPSVV